MNWDNFFLGRNPDLGILEMCIRGLLVFIATLALLRIAGLRTFGKQKAFDRVVVFMMGAILSRPVVGASPFLPCFGACLTMVIIHRILGWLSCKNEGLGKMIKGEKMELFANRQLNATNMKKAMISEKDLMEGVRLQINQNTLDDIDVIFMERDGEISVVKQARETRE